MINIQNTPFDGAQGIALNKNLAVGNRLYFPDLAILRNKYITSVQIFVPNADGTQTPDGQEIIVQELSSMYLTLCDFTNREFMSDFELTNLIHKKIQHKINRPLVLQNCYIRLSDALGWDDFPGDVLYFIFYYTDKSKPEIPSIPTSLKKIEFTALHFSAELSGLPECKKNIQTVEIPIPTNIKKIYFTDNRVLVNRIFSTLYSLTDTGNVSPAGFSVANVEQCFLTLMYNSTKSLDRVPLSLFYQVDKDFKTWLDNINIDLPSSYVELSNDYVFNQLQSIVLSFEYLN